MSEVPGMPPLFYRAEGEGPLVIMLHGLLMNGRCWDDNGFIAAISPFFNVVCPDLAGHGASEKSDIQDFYRRENQALAVVKLMDELGYEKAHLVGYSAGSWLAMELLRSYPERLSSVVLGGWDCLKGLPDISGSKLTFEMFMSYARQVAPELTETLSSKDEISAGCFFNELRKPVAGDANLFPCHIPVMFWAGSRDPYYASMAELAGQHAIPLICGEGDHLGEINHPDRSTIAQVLNYIKDQ